MTKNETILMLISIFTLWINSFFNDTIQFYSGFILIFLVGILHGCNDIILIKRTHENETLSNNKLIIYYVLVVLFGFIMFYFIPVIALFLFIVASSYHFGEQHWNNLKHKKIKIIITIFQTIYGFLIFMLLFNFHETEVNKIIFTIIRRQIIFLDFSKILFFTSITLLILTIILYQQIKNFRKLLLINLVYLVVFSLIFKTADLIWGFAIYFAIWHSLPSIRDQIIFIYGKISITNLKKYILNALPFWIVSLLGISVLFYFFKDYAIFETIFFSFLAAITFPHVFIMIKLFQRKSE